MLIILVSLTNCNRTSDNQKTTEKSSSVKDTLVDKTDRTNDFYDNSETYKIGRAHV